MAPGVHPLAGKSGEGPPLAPVNWSWRAGNRICDMYFISPQGQKFRSRLELANYLKTLSNPPDPSLFVWRVKGDVSHVSLAPTKSVNKRKAQSLHVGGSKRAKAGNPLFNTDGNSSASPIAAVSHPSQGVSTIVPVVAVSNSPQGFFTTVPVVAVSSSSQRLSTICPPVVRKNLNKGGKSVKHFSRSFNSVLAERSSFKWLSNSDTLEKFLEEARMLKYKSTAEFSETRKIMRERKLDMKNICKYPNNVLRIFYRLLRNEEPPKNMGKIELATLCMDWEGKVSNYWSLRSSDCTAKVKMEEAENRSLGEKRTPAGHGAMGKLLNDSGGQLNFANPNDRREHKDFHALNAGSLQPSSLVNTSDGHVSLPNLVEKPVLGETRSALVKDSVQNQKVRQGGNDSRNVIPRERIRQSSVSAGGETSQREVLEGSSEFVHEKITTSRQKTKESLEKLLPIKSEDTVSPELLRANCSQIMPGVSLSREPQRSSCPGESIVIINGYNSRKAQELKDGSAVGIAVVNSLAIPSQSTSTLNGDSRFCSSCGKECESRSGANESKSKKPCSTGLASCCDDGTARLGNVVRDSEVFHGKSPQHGNDGMEPHASGRQESSDGSEDVLKRGKADMNASEKPTESRCKSKALVLHDSPYDGSQDSKMTIKMDLMAAYSKATSRNLEDLEEVLLQALQVMSATNDRRYKSAEGPAVEAYKLLKQFPPMSQLRQLMQKVKDELQLQEWPRASNTTNSELSTHELVEKGCHAPSDALNGKDPTMTTLASGAFEEKNMRSTTVPEGLLMSHQARADYEMQKLWDMRKLEEENLRSFSELDSKAATWINSLKSQRKVVATTQAESNVLRM